MSVFKNLKSSDITNVPYVANKQWNINYVSDSGSSEITVFKGTNVTGSFNPSSDPQTSGQYERLIYTTINHMFYQEYSGSYLSTSSLASSLNYISASGERPTGSYFDYNNNPAFNAYFPTGSLENITVIAINQNIFGSKLLPSYIHLTSSLYHIVDDGIGNLYDVSGLSPRYVFEDYVIADYIIEGTGDVYVGNVFYAHGMIVITNQDYQTIFFD